jgi:hypothetical protein
VRKTLLSIVAASVIALAMPLCAAANCGDTFTIYNAGSHTVYTVNVEPHDYCCWGPDLLRDDVLNPGYHFEPLLFYYGMHPNTPSVMQDVRVVYSNGYVITDMDVNICAYNVVLHY